MWIIYIWIFWNHSVNYLPSIKRNTVSVIFSFWWSLKSCWCLLAVPEQFSVLWFANQKVRKFKDLFCKIKRMPCFLENINKPELQLKKRVKNYISANKFIMYILVQKSFFKKVHLVCYYFWRVFEFFISQVTQRLCVYLNGFMTFILTLTVTCVMTIIDEYVFAFGHE